jgi:hypothetical protein
VEVGSRRISRERADALFVGVEVELESGGTGELES